MGAKAQCIKFFRCRARTWQFIKYTKISKLPIFTNGNSCGPVNIDKSKLNINKWFMKSSVQKYLKPTSVFLPKHKRRTCQSQNLAMGTKT